MPDPLLPILLDAALRGTLIALLGLLAAVLLRDRPRLPAARAGVALALGLIVQVASSTPWFEASVSRLWQTPLVAVSVGNAVLFWVFVQALFDDEFALRPVHVAAWLLAAAVSGLNCALLNGSGLPLASVTLGLQRATPLVFSALAAAAAASHWRDDLIEGRRRLRGFIVVTGICYTLAMLVARLGSPQGRLSNAMASLDVVALLVIAAVVAWRLLRLTSSELFPSAGRRTAASTDACVVPTPVAAATAEPADAPPMPAPPDPAEQRLAATLERLMAEERIYRSEDLTVSRLASRLAVPEYRLRRLINQRLGFRNFNAYVNAFRLDEAQGALADPARRSLPVLSIALDAGFQSIGPFNRAFKLATGRTPSEFRREKLGQSLADS